jgi:hypothetical protein
LTKITRASERAAGEISRPPARLPAKPAPSGQPTHNGRATPARYANTPSQVVSQAVDDGLKTRRLIAICVSVILAGSGGIALIVLALHGIHLPHGFLLPVGLGTGATSVIAGIIAVLNRVLRRAAKSK